MKRLKKLYCAIVGHKEWRLVGGNVMICTRCGVNGYRL